MNVATLHLMCGLPCSGKTTLAKQLARQHRALRLTPDEWHTRLFGQDAESPEHDARHAAVEALQWEVAAEVLSSGVDVILDFGFWSRDERVDFRSRASAIGAKTLVHFLDVSEETLFGRLALRNDSLPAGSFRISPRLMKEYVTVFQAPSEHELDCG
jgi:hypothetical protein